MSAYAANVRAASQYDALRRAQKEKSEYAQAMAKVAHEAKVETENAGLTLLELTKGMPASVRAGQNTFRGFLSKARIQVYPPDEGKTLETVAVYIEVTNGKRTYSGVMESPGLSATAQMNLNAYLELRAHRAKESARKAEGSEALRP